MTVNRKLFDALKLAWDWRGKQASDRPARVDKTVMDTIEEAWLEIVWDILERTCGAMPGMRDEFVSTATRYIKDGKSLEFRFQGDLGFGGKIWIEERRPIRVSCYPEDENPERVRKMAVANRWLKELGR